MAWPCQKIRWAPWLQTVAYNTKRITAIFFHEWCQQLWSIFVHLPHHHYSVGVFHFNMKECLFSTPIGNTTVNFSCDSKGTMDHRDVMKEFRSGSTTRSVVSWNIPDWPTEWNPQETDEQCRWIGLDWICLTTTHVLQDILAVLHKWMFQNCFHSLNNYSSPIILSSLGASWS